MESYLHIHPDYRVEKNGASFHITETSGKTIALIEALEANEVRMESGISPNSAGDMKTM